jgi:hypothetical protein
MPSCCSVAITTGRLIITAAYSGLPGSPYRVFRAANPIPLTRGGLTAAEFRAQNQQAHKDGLKLVWMDSYGTPSDTRYIATWWPNPELEAWSCDAVDEDLATLQQRFDGLTATWARAAHMAMTPSGRGLELFTDDRIGGYVSRAGMSADEYQKTFDQMRAEGLSPLRVSAKSNGGGRVAAGRGPGCAPRGRRRDVRDEVRGGGNGGGWAAVAAGSVGARIRTGRRRLPGCRPGG